MFDKEQKEWSYHLQFTIGYRYYSVSTLVDDQHDYENNTNINLKIYQVDIDQEIQDFKDNGKGNENATDYGKSQYNKTSLDGSSLLQDNENLGKAINCTNYWKAGISFQDTAFDIIKRIDKNYETRIKNSFMPKFILFTLRFF